MAKKNNKRTQPQKKTAPTFAKANAGEAINISHEEMEKRKAAKAKADAAAKVQEDEAKNEAQESQDALENQEGGNAPKMVKHVVTEEDIENNPSLANDGVKVGDEIEIPVEDADEDDSESDEASDESQTQEDNPNMSDPSQETKPEDKKQNTPKKTDIQRKGSFDRLARPTGDVKYGLVFASRAGSFVHNGTRFSKDSCNPDKPYMPKSEQEFLELHASGHFKKVAV